MPDAQGSEKVLDVLRTMVRVTMMRGAQTGGVVTYARSRRGDSRLATRGVRSRVVNGKRTDLSKLVTSALRRSQRVAALTSGLLEDAARLYCGHTRFATSSKATFDGTHPHQWTPPKVLEVYTGFGGGGALVPTTQPVEVYICHNGDFDFFEVGGRSYDLEVIQNWLECVTRHRRPSSVDSAAVAGVFDLLRAQGIWTRAVRYAYLFETHRGRDMLERNAPLPPEAAFEAVAAVLSDCCAAIAATASDAAAAREALLERARDKMVLVGGGGSDALRALLGAPGGDVESGQAEHIGFVDACVEAFHENDLLWSVRYFLKNAKVRLILELWRLHLPGGRSSPAWPSGSVACTTVSWPRRLNVL